MKKSWVAAAGLALLCLLLARCGGGGGGGTGPGGGGTPPPTASFTLAVTPSAVTLPQGGSGQSVQVIVTPKNGFSGTVAVALTGLPSGVTPTPSSLSVTSSAPATLLLSAASTTSISQQSVTLTGTSGSLSATAALQITVTGPSVSDPFVPTGGALTGGFYDETRQLLYTCNFGLNEVDIFSGKNFSLQQRVPVHQPWGMDQMADGKTLVIGTQTQEIVTLDQDTLAVTEHPLSEHSFGVYGLTFPNLVALANGKVIIIGQEVGVDSDDILDGGQYLFVWDSTSNTFSQLEPKTPNGVWETDRLSRSADHKWAVFTGDQFYLYSSDTDSFTTASFNTVNPPDNPFNVRGYAINGDGSEIAVVSAQQVTFLNNSLAVLATVQIPGAFQGARTVVKFSADGSKLYLQNALPVWLEVLDAKNYAVLGSLSGTVNPDGDNNERMLDVNAEGYAFVGIDEGLRWINLQQTPYPNQPNLDGVIPNCPTFNQVLGLNSSMPVETGSDYSNISLFVGAQPAPLINSGSQATIPASSVAGPADEVCVDNTSGNISVTPDAVSYGVQIVALDGNWFPPTGHPTTYIFGYGFSEFDDGNPTALTVGGQPATNLNTNDEYSFGTLEAVGFQLPDGTPGGSATIKVTSPVGSAQLATPVQYYDAPTILPATGVLQLLYDTHRNVVYALKSNEVDVLDATALTWKSPLSFPAAATAVFNTMALSPDGSKLVVGGATTDTFPKLQYIVINPDDISSASVVTNTGNQESSWAIAISDQNVAIIAGDPVLRLDLSTLQFTTQSDIEAGVVRASADGKHIYAMTSYGDGGALSSIDPVTYAVQTNGYGIMFFVDLAVSPDGSNAVDIQIGQQGTGCALGFFNSNLEYINANVYPDLAPPDDSGVFGAAFSPSGKVLMVPMGDALEFWDVADGTFRARVMMPEELQVYVAPANAASPTVAVDSTGQSVYAVSVSGITVIKLPQPMDQLTPATWPIALRAGGPRPSAINRLIKQRVAALPAAAKASPAK